MAITYILPSFPISHDFVSTDTLRASVALTPSTQRSPHRKVQASIQNPSVLCDCIWALLWSDSIYIPSVERASALHIAGLIWFNVLETLCWLTGVRMVFVMLSAGVAVVSVVATVSVDLDPR